MRFDQFLNDYMTIKRLKGVTPGPKVAEATFAPYFDRQFDIDMAGRKQALAERAQTSKESQQGQELSWDKERTLADLAATKEMTLGKLAGAKYATQGDRETNRSIALSRLAADRDIAIGRMQLERDISYSNLAWDRERAAGLLDYDRWVQNLLKDQASVQDRNATIGNVINLAGSLGNMYMTDQYYKKYGYRR